MFSKVNLIEKLPEVYRKQELWEIFCVSLYKLNSFVESGIALQFIEKNSLANFLIIVEKINEIQECYLDFFIDVFLLEKLVEKFYGTEGNEDIVERLVERIGNPECYQFQSEERKNRVLNLQKVNFIKRLRLAMNSSFSDKN